MTFYKFSIVFFISILINFIAESQTSSDFLKKFIDSDSFKNISLQYPTQVKDFYVRNSFASCWVTNIVNLVTLSTYIQKSTNLGLSQEDYQQELIKKFNSASLKLIDRNDSLVAEIKFTDAAIHFFHDVLMGNKQEPLEYNGLNYSPSCYDVSALLYISMYTRQFTFLLNETECKDKEYVAVKDRLVFFNKIIATPNFKNTVVTLKKIEGNRPLLIKLYQLGIMDIDTTNLSEAKIVAKVKDAQKMFGLMNDGILRSTLLEQLNIPLQNRMNELKSLLNTLRWLNCIKQSNHIVVVNIPSANLLLYEHGKIVVESNIIVGKIATKTPTLCSKITEVILYPYWHVPYKIATKEILPAVKRNRGYLDKHNFQILNMQGKIINPENIKWSSLSTRYFPYVIRQSTGCDNSLGLIKLNFYNPFSVYLHDTPSKNLFSSNKRYFSHGCMRLQKAMEIGHYILKNNSIAIDTLSQKGCILNQEPLIVPATEQIPVFVLYHTAWIDSNSVISFSEDIYNKIKYENK